MISHPKTAKHDAKKLFTFLTRPVMSRTNNHAERALRKPVISRKTSFGSRSDSGAHAFAILASLLALHVDKTNPHSISSTHFSRRPPGKHKPSFTQIHRETQRPNWAKLLRKINLTLDSSTH